MAKNKIIVIGGGAAGLMAAITAARAGAKVTVLERKDRVGKKILATGNGRCNMSNEVITPERFHSDSGDIFEAVYDQLPLEATLKFFEELGIETVTLEAGKLYPMSLQAASVLNVLRYECQRLGVRLCCEQEVTGISLSPKVTVTTATKNWYGDKVILATGGKSAPDLGSNGSGYFLAEKLGLRMVAPYPSLVQLTSDYHYLKHLKGTKMMADVSVVLGGEVVRSVYGELLLTDYGVSGPPVLQVSRHASKALQKGQRDVHLKIDLMPKVNREAMDQMLLRRIENMPYKPLEVFFEGMLPKALVVPIVKDNGLALDMKASDISKKMRQNITDWLKGFTIKITGTKQWHQSQATAGGVACTMVDGVSLRSHKHPNLYLCGEVLDVDGDSGGFNLQWAWSSGYVAGRHASGAQSL